MRHVIKVGHFTILEMLTECVGDPRAWNFKKLSTTQPQFKAQFVILAIPDNQLLVITAEVKELIFPDSERTAKHDGKR